MSHTVIPDHRDHGVLLENIHNHIHRHCRVRNVVWKPVRAPKIPLPIKPPIVFGPWPNLVQYFGPESRKCACLPGQACGNVACPYRLIATCGPNTSQTMGRC